MDNKTPNIVADIINNDKLRGSLYSTFSCQYCGGKLTAYPTQCGLEFECETRECGARSHIQLDLNEIAAIFNFNPLL